MNKFLWASPHTPTKQQRLEMHNNVVLLQDKKPDLFNRLSNIHIGTDLDELSVELLQYCLIRAYTLVQPAGSPAFMAVLGKHRIEFNKVPIIFSFSKRMSIDEEQPDGSIKKVSIFKHEGFINI